MLVIWLPQKQQRQLWFRRLRKQQKAEVDVNDIKFRESVDEIVEESIKEKYSMK